MSAPKNWTTTEWIFRGVGAIAFVGTLINMIYGFQTTDPNSSENTGHKLDPTVIHVLPFFIVGLLGLYAAWYGPPSMEGIERRNRAEGLLEIGAGFLMIVLGVGISVAISMMTSGIGLVIAATGLIGGGAVLGVKGLMTVFTGRDFS